jgi:HPt (histidine-containing phosphotransfer) domain-containing protein
MNDNAQTSGPLLPGVQTREAIARFAGDEQRYRHWLIEFISYGTETASRIRAALANDLPEQAINLSHALKGRVGLLGMTELHSIVQSLEMTLRNKEPSTLWLEELEHATDEMSRQISAAFGAERPESGRRCSDQTRET